MPTRPPAAPPATALLLATAALAACGGRHYLADYDFAGSTLAVVTYGTPAPQLWTGAMDVEADDPLNAILEAGGRVAREIEARSARTRLDSAAHRLRMDAHLAERAGERVATYLGARSGPRDRADFLLELDIERLGLDASREYPHLYVRGTAILLEARTGREIWSEDVHGNDPLTSGLYRDDLVGDVATVAALRSMSVDDFELVLRALTDYVADRVADGLQDDLRDVRRPRPDAPG